MLPTHGSETHTPPHLTICPPPAPVPRRAVVCRGGAADVAELHALCADYCTRLGALAPPEQQRQQGVEAEAEAGAQGEGEEPSSSGRTFEEASAEAALQR